MTTREFAAMTGGLAAHQGEPLKRERLGELMQRFPDRP